MSIHQQLRQAREARSLTRKQLSAITGITEKSIEKYETTIEPPLRNLKTLIAVLGIDPEAVFSEPDVTLTLTLAEFRRVQKTGRLVIILEAVEAGAV